MRVGDVDLESMTISVRRTASAGLSGRLVVGPTKGGRARIAPLPEPFLPVVLAAMDGRDEHDLLFPGPRGGHINSQNLSRAVNWRSDTTSPPPERVGAQSARRDGPDARGHGGLGL